MATTNSSNRLAATQETAITFLQRAGEKADSLPGQFLHFLFNDIAQHPELIQAIDVSLVQRIYSLVYGIEIDLNCALPADDLGTKRAAAD